MAYGQQPGKCGVGVPRREAATHPLRDGRRILALLPNGLTHRAHKTAGRSRLGLRGRCKATMTQAGNLLRFALRYNGGNARASRRGKRADGIKPARGHRRR